MAPWYRSAGVVAVALAAWPGAAAAHAGHAELLHSHGAAHALMAVAGLWAIAGVVAVGRVVRRRMSERDSGAVDTRL